MYGLLDEELFEGKGKQTFEKHKPFMQNILEERVFYVEKVADSFYLSENCDGWFRIELTPEICDNLSSFFSDLKSYLKERSVAD